jgi:hypothetical protein
MSRTVEQDCQHEVVILRLQHFNNITDPNFCCLCFRFEVLTAVKMSMLLFCVIPPCGLVGTYQRFGGTSCLHLQDSVHHACFEACYTGSRPATCVLLRNALMSEPSSCCVVQHSFKVTRILNLIKFRSAFTVLYCVPGRVACGPSFWCVKCATPPNSPWGNSQYRPTVSLPSL